MYTIASFSMDIARCLLQRGRERERGMALKFYNAWKSAVKILLVAFYNKRNYFMDIVNIFSTQLHYYHRSMAIIS